MNQQILQKKVEIPLHDQPVVPDLSNVELREFLIKLSNTMAANDRKLRKELEILKGRVLQDKVNRIEPDKESLWQNVPIVEEEKGCEHSCHTNQCSFKDEPWKWCPMCKKKL